MGIDRADIPEEYSCEQCMPRRVHKARARLIQKKRRSEILRNGGEDENSNGKKSNNILKVNVKNSGVKFAVQQRSKKLQSRMKNATTFSNKKKRVLNSNTHSQQLAVKVRPHLLYPFKTGCQCETLCLWTALCLGAGLLQFYQIYSMQ